MDKTVLVTGGAGFIGSILSDVLLDVGYSVINIDNFNKSYEPLLKRENIRECISNNNYKLYVGDIRDKEFLERLFNENNINFVIHLAALAGVRESLFKPIEYIENDICGTVNLLEAIRKFPVEKLIFGSSSSVYGRTNRIPFVEDDKLELQISPYATAKRSGELYCATYSYLYNIPTVILRFFTVYGPRQRPEMAIYKFTRLIYDGEKVPIYGNGLAKRDYTYIDDIVEGIIKAMNAKYDFEVFNLGSGNSVEIIEVVQIIKRIIGKPAGIVFLPEQKGDVPLTLADISKARRMIGYNPSTSISEGIEKFVDWFLKNRNSYE